MTLPVFGFPLYEAMGYVYHPDYTSLYCDTEMTALFAKMNVLATSPTPVSFDTLGFLAIIPRLTLFIREMKTQKCTLKMVQFIRSNEE